jgi:hypothetical protein
MGIFSCSSARITPTWANPRAAPPPSTSAIFGFGGSTTGGGTETQEASMPTVAIIDNKFIFFMVTFIYYWEVVYF